MDQDLKALQLSWPAQQKAIRADIISNKSIIRMLIKLVLSFFIICYVSKMLPDAQKILQYVPQKWERVDILDLHQVSPLNRNIKVYVAPANISEDIDHIYEAQVFTLIDNQEKDRRLYVKVLDLDRFTDISENSLRFYLGDVHVLDQVAYRIKISKPIKVKRRFLQYPSDLITNSTDQNQNSTFTQQIKQKQQVNNTINDQITNETSNYTDKDSQQITNNSTESNMTEEERHKIQQQEKKKEQQRKRKEEEEKIKKEEEQRKRMEEQERKKKEEEQKKKKEEEQQRKRQQQQQRKRKQQQQRQRIEEEEKRKIYEYTNIRIQAHMISNLGTVLELVIRYISILVIIYMAADNADAPKAIALICTLTSNPLLFLQISYPNQVSNIIDSFCQSGPLLYLSLWMYYIHTKIKYTQQTEYKLFLAVKITLGFLLYFLNVLRILHFQVLIWETLAAIAVILLISIHLWDAFLNLHYQHHRDKVLSAVTLTYLGSLFTFKILAAPWQDIMIYIIVQLYGFNIIYLTGSQKKKKQKRQQSKQRTVDIELQKVATQQMRDEIEIQQKK